VLVDRLPTPQAYIVGHSPRGIGHRAVLRIHLLPAQWLAKYKVSSLTPFEEWATPPAQRMVGRVISVTQAGDLASVLLGFDNADDLSDGWVDLYTLLRIARPPTPVDLDHFVPELSAFWPIMVNTASSLLARSRRDATRWFGCCTSLSTGLGAGE